MCLGRRILNSGFLFALVATAALAGQAATASAQTPLPPQPLGKMFSPQIAATQLKAGAKTDIKWSSLRKARPVSFWKLRSHLDGRDQAATLFALQIALMRVGDGQTYVWGRPKRRLRAYITPVKSFRNKQGRICRDLRISLSLGGYTRRIETTACRADDKSWQLQS